MKSLITLDPRLPSKSVFIDQGSSHQLCSAPFYGNSYPFSFKIVALQSPSPMQGLQSQERAVTCHQNVYWLKRDQGHVVEVVVIANSSLYTLLTASLLLALSTTHLSTNPYKTVFFLYRHIQCVEDLASSHTWWAHDSYTWDSSGKVSFSFLINLSQCHGDFHLCLSSYPSGKPSRWNISPFNTMALGVPPQKTWPPSTGDRGWATAVWWWCLGTQCWECGVSWEFSPGSIWASQAYHQHFWYIPSLRSHPSHPHR